MMDAGVARCEKEFERVYMGTRDRYSYVKGSHQPTGENIFYDDF